MMRLALLATLIGASTALASPGPRLETVPLVGTPHAQTATVLYLNRCVGGCRVTKGGVNHAPSHTSQIPDGPSGTEYTLTEYAWGDGEWDAFMQCMREVYSPYGVTITDQLPTAGIAYNEGIVAGSDGEIGLSGVGGIAPVTNDCSPYSYVISFTFANDYGPNNTFTVCSVAAQETGHSFGLDHSYEFVDGSSACRDPMSYRGDCGGQRFFRNDQARCGEFSERDCRCGPTQNTHLKLMTVLGPGTPITEPPTVSIAAPTAGETIGADTRVIATAFAQRGIAKVELWLNGYKWAEAKGVAWGGDGQPEAGYPIAIPVEVPDSVLDIVVKAADDLGVTTETPPLRVTKGAACQGDDTCAKGQRCDAEGRCLWDAPVGELGVECEYPQYCKSGTCAGTADGELRCTQPCTTTNADSCPESFECLASGTAGVCWPVEAADPDCCSSANGPGSLLLALGLGFAWLAPRRRRGVRSAR